VTDTQATDAPKDLTEYLKNGATPADVQRLVDAAVPYVAEETPSPSGAAAKPEKRNGATHNAARPHRKPIAERIVDLADVEAPGELPLLFGQYLLKGAAHWLTGATGLGKTTWAMNLCCALAEGKPLWGIECEQTRILYCDMESGDLGRAIKIERLYRDAPRVRGQLLFLREPVKLPNELDELLAYVKEQGIGLVVFDTARRCFSVKDENDNAEVYNQVVPTLDALKQAGVATLTMGHPSKNGNAGARGAGAQEDAGDVNLSLTMHGGADVSDPNGVLSLRVTKNRVLGLGISPLLLRRVGGDQFERAEAGAEEREEPITKQMQCRQAVMDALAGVDSSLSHGALLEAAKGAGFSKATFERCIKHMRDEEEVCRAGDGYALTDPFAED